MKRLLTIALLALTSLAFGATTTPVSLLSPAGSTAGQTIVSTGSSSAPAWGSVPVGGLAAIAANSVLANATGSSATPTAFAMPSCSGTNNALRWTSGSGFTCASGIALTSGTLAQFAATTSAQLAGVISDETGSGSLVFSVSPALTGTPTAPAPATATNNTQIATTSFAYNLLAAPPAIGSSTPNAGTFTTLKGNSLAKVFATNTSAQSIASGSNVAVTGWTTGFDANSNFNASTGTFTAPTTGYYVVTAQLAWGTMAGAGAGGLLKATVFVNGSATSLQGFAAMSSTTQQNNVVQVSGIVSASAGQTIVLNAVQNSGSAVALQSGTGAVWMSIYQLP